MAGGNYPHVLVVDRHFAASVAQHRGRTPPVGAGKEHDRSAGRGQSFHARVQFKGKFVRIAPVEQQVIAACVKSDQIRLELDGRTHLLFENLVKQPPADGQVRIGEIFVTGGQFFRDPVRPAAEAAGGSGGSGSPKPSVNESPKAT